MDAEKKRHPGERRAPEPGLPGFPRARE